MRRLLGILIGLWLTTACATHKATGATSAPQVDAPVAVSVYPKLADTQTDITVTIRMAENDNNRGLKVVVDGLLYTSSVDDWTSGVIKSPKILTKSFKGITEGHYTVTGLLLRADGHVYQAYDTFCVAGPNTDCASIEPRS
jgi:hypothetical protein